MGTTEFKDVLKKLRLERGWTQLDLSKKLGTAKNTVANWEQGARIPKLDKLEEIADLFNVDVDFLIGKSTKTTRIINPLGHKSTEAVRVPILGRVAAGMPIDRIEDIVGQEMIPAAVAESGDYFALRIQGDSMYPRIYDGDTVIVRSQNTAENGDIVIASVNGFDATCKIFTQTENGVMLRPLNGNYEPIFLSDVNGADFCIVGKVVEIRARV